MATRDISNEQKPEDKKKEALFPSRRFIYQG
jgi:hypothetical protein